MIVRLCVVVCLAALSAINAEVIVKDGSYHDLVISFSHNVDAEKGKSIVESLKDLLEDTSQVLHKAIGLRIGGVTFHLPSSWDTSTWEEVTVDPTSTLPVGEEDLLVDNVVDSAFGNQPFAFQYGGCGVPARRVTVPVEFLNPAEGYPKEKLLAREWLKYRYGVFDENGFDGDALYPSYYLTPGTIEPKITECTHPDVEYYYKDTDNNPCTLAIPFASSANCEIHPNEDSLNVTSSLMYYHEELLNMETVCGKEHVHKDSTPSKQNILCSGSSIWDILKLSEDFNGTDTTNETGEHQHGDERIQFSFRQETKPRVVVAFESSANLHYQGNLVLFAIRRFLHVLPEGSELGLYSFNEQPAQIRPLSPLSDRDFAIPSEFDEDANVCTGCVVSKALEALEDKPQVRSSIILIVGSDSSAIDENLVKKLTTLNACLTIVAFTSEETKAVGYEELISASSCNSIVHISKEPSFTDLIFGQLYTNLQKSVPQTPTNSPISMVNSGNITAEESLNITMNSNAGKYTLWTERPLEVNRINCTSGEKEVALSPGVKSNTISSYTFDPAEDEVKCRLKNKLTKEVFTQVEMTTKSGEFVDGEVWIHDTSESDEQMPVIIYAKINFGNYPIQDANVTASVIGPDGKMDKFDLFDNGRGNPDITQNDGIYSRSYVNFAVEGDHKVFLIASDNAGESKVGKKGQDHCCGSKVNSAQEPAGFFVKSFTTSFVAKKKSVEGFKPSKVMDLRVDRFDPSNSVVLKWTAPGGQADRGIAKTYILKYFTNREDALQNFDKGLPYNVSTTDPKEYGNEETFEIRFDNGNFEQNTAYYLAMRSRNDFGLESDTSNILEFFIPVETDTTAVETTTDPSSLEDDKQSSVNKKTIGIVIGVLVAVIVVIAIVYLFVHFFVRKPRQKEAKRTSGGGSRNTTTPPVSMNSISADVILKHHNEVVSAKNQHKDPPIFTEANLEPVNSATASQRDGDGDDDSQRNNVEYSQVQKRQPESESTNQYPPKSPKRMTNV